MKPAITGTDRVIAAYNVVLTGAWLAVLDVSRLAPIAALAHAIAAAMPWILLRRAGTRTRTFPAHPSPLGTRRPRSGRSPGTARAEPAAGPAHRSLTGALRELYSLIAIMVFWIELDPLIAALDRPRLDGWVLVFDERVFGRHLHLFWPAHASSPLLGEAMYLAYSAYYLLIFAPPLVLYLGRRTDALHDALFRLMLAYLACYVFYLAFPTLGTRYVPGQYEASGGGVFARITGLIHESGDSRGTAFPSSHVAGAVTIAVAGWQWFSRPVAVLLTIEAAAVVASTVYTQNHYAIDSLAGLTGTLGLQLVMIPAVLQIRRSMAGRAQLPVLPDFERMRKLDRIVGAASVSGTAAAGNTRRCA